MKKLILLFGFSLVCNMSVRAQRLLGEYFEEFDYIGEYGARYRFDINSQFDYYYWDDVGNQFGAGSFSISNDSLILNFGSIPKQMKMMHISSQPSEKEVSTIHVLHPIPSMPTWQCSYRIMEGDSLIRGGKSGQYGFFETRIEENQTLIVFAHSDESYDLVSYPLQFEIEGKNQQQDFVVVATGIMCPTHLLPYQTKAYPIRIRKKGERFGLKIANEWIWYKIRNR